MVRLGVVGVGRRGRGLLSIFGEIEPAMRVVGVVDLDEAGARSRLPERDRDSATFYPSLAEMVQKAKLDGLLIATRCNMHTPLAIEAAQYRLPLYLEKPVAISYEQAEALEHAYASGDHPVVVSFPLRVTPLCQQAKRMLDAGAVGEPVHVTATNYVSYGTVYWEEGYRDYEVTGGLFLQKATHDFDYLMYLMNARIRRIGAMATYQKVFGGTRPSGLRCSSCDETDTCLESPQNRKRNSVSGSNPDDHNCVFSIDCGSIETGTNEDCSSAVFEFESGAHGAYTQVFFTRRDANARGPIISGYNGTLSFDWGTNKIRHVQHHAPFTNEVKASDSGSHGGGDHELARDFFGLIAGKRSSRTPIETGIQSAYTCLAARESTQTGQFVNVRQVGQAGADSAATRRRSLSVAAST